jgi:hypothetical protein
MEDSDIVVGDFVAPYGKYAKELFESYKVSYGEVVLPIFQLPEDIVMVEIAYEGRNQMKFKRNFQLSTKKRSPNRIIKMNVIEWE